jgi:hypothetical protein
MSQMALHSERSPSRCYFASAHECIAYMAAGGDLPALSGLFATTGLANGPINWSSVSPSLLTTTIAM